MSTQTIKLKIFSIDWLHSALILLTLGGMGVSAYLMWGYTVPGAALACGQSHGCETVKNSVYANLLGVPLPVIGLATFLIIFILLILQKQHNIQARGWQPYIVLALFGISLTGVLYSIYLTYLELFVIYAICRWCVASAIIMTAIFALSIFNLRTAQ